MKLTLIATVHTTAPSYIAGSIESLLKALILYVETPGQASSSEILSGCRQFRSYCVTDKDLNCYRALAFKDGFKEAVEAKGFLDLTDSNLLSYFYRGYVPAERAFTSWSLSERYALGRAEVDSGVVISRKIQAKDQLCDLNYFLANFKNLEELTGLDTDYLKNFIGGREEILVLQSPEMMRFSLDELTWVD